MATKKKSKTKNEIVLLSESAKENPVRFPIAPGSWVGIGGEIQVPARPPKIGYVIKEATEEQYLELARSGRCIHLKIK